MISRRTALIAGASFGASALLGASTASASGHLAEQQSSDLLVLNARIITLDPRQPSAEAVLIRNGRIAHVGDANDLRRLARTTKVFDAAGRTLVPGLIDGHTHLEWYAESFSFHTAFPSPLESLQQAFAILRDAAAKTPPGRWVIGRGNFAVQNQVVERRLATRVELDAISQEHPIVLFSSVHEATLNSKAFQALGLWTEQDQRSLKWKDGSPRVGSVVHRGANGVPTGVVTEIFDLLLDQPLFPFSERVAAYGRHARQDFATKGLTTIVNMSGNPDHIRADQAAQQYGDLPLRIRMFHIVPLVDSLSRIRDQGTKRGDGDPWYRFSGVKVFVDGDGEDGAGHELEDLKWTPEALTKTVDTCNRAGYPVVFHVVTKGGFDLALNSIADAERKSGRRLRHQIHHLGSLLKDSEARRRVKALGVTLGLTRADRGGQWPETIDYRELLDEQIPVVCCSDSAGSFRPFSALEGIASLATPREEGGVLAAGRHVTFEQALRMWTTTSAYANYEEQHLGSISVGKLGDLAVLSGTPTDSPLSSLFDLKVDATILGGRVVFDRSAA